MQSPLQSREHQVAEDVCMVEGVVKAQGGEDGGRNKEDDTAHSQKIEDKWINRPTIQVIS